MADHHHHTRSKANSQPFLSLSDNESASLLTNPEMASSSDLSSSILPVNDQVDLSTPDTTSNLAEIIKFQKEILAENQQFKHSLHQHEIAINNLVQLFDRLTDTKPSTGSIKPELTTDVGTVNSSTGTLTSNLDPATKQLRAKQISQLFESTPFSGSATQDVVDWLHEFNRKCEDIRLDDTQRLSIARGLMKNDAKLWMETLSTSPMNWSMFQQQLTSYFQLAAGIDCFSFSEQLYTRQQQLRETAIHYYHDIMRLCAKVDTTMSDITRLRHLYRGLRPESKVLISLHSFKTPDEFLQELVRLEQLQKVSESSSEVTSINMASYPSSMPNDIPYHANRRGSYQSSPQAQGSSRSYRSNSNRLSSHQSYPPSPSFRGNNRRLNAW